ncbi:13663_t:CDS:2 [Ambispora gerdemannii]|uniref:13663_t:CDS:1 n=1 Tax=Ambispora gerdemannii TaxID=144530 RepID=A0A9N8WJU5_9GLOM|nr:13663_t:CDS:2 [Ambispora gerdemannii]
MGTVNGGTIISFPTPSLNALNSRMPTFSTFQLPQGNINMNANRSFFFPSSTTLPTITSNSPYLLAPSLVANASKKNTNSAERRANHNAVERARRECLNSKFQDLAHALPSLAQVRRPSKSIIVQKSLEFIILAQQKDELHEKDLREMRSENDSLREEIDRLRKQLGLEPLPPREDNLSPSDDAKEDAISSNTDIKTTAISDAIIKSEEVRSDDDENSDGNLDDEYDMDSTDIMTGKTGAQSQNINESQQHSCLYDNQSELTYMLDTGFPPNFDFSSLQLHPSLDPMNDATGIPLNFDSPVHGDIGMYSSDPYSLTQKFYPSPPYQAAILDMNGHMPGYSLSPESSHM